MDQRIGGGEPLPGNRHIAKPVDDPFVTAEDIGVRLQEFVMRDFCAARPELHYVHDIKRQTRQLRQALGKRRLAASGIAEHRHSVH
jgi:hypothetical protein